NSSVAIDPNEDVRRIPREVLALFPLVNRRDDSPRNRFSVTSEDVRAAEKAAAIQGLEVIGWYHSHPDHPARPSDYDREHAWPWYSYIIVSVHTGVPKDMTSWRLKDDRSGYFEEKIAPMRVSAAD
ncbi:MAG TPA: M67 family metallopeptidase, partial [Candidatus Acidoferrum sp.]